MKNQESILSSFWCLLFKRFRSLALWRIVMFCVLLACWLWRIRPLLSPFDDVTNDPESAFGSSWNYWFGFARQELLELFLQLILPSLYLLQLLPSSFGSAGGSSLISSAFVASSAKSTNAQFLDCFSGGLDTLQEVFDRCNRFEVQLEQQKNKQSIASEQLQNFSQEWRQENMQLKKQVKSLTNEQSQLKERIHLHLTEFGKDWSEKLEQIKLQCPAFDVKGRKQFFEMFETADAAVDLIQRRDQQLKDLFKVTTELQLQKDKVNWTNFI